MLGIKPGSLQEQPEPALQLLRGLAILPKESSSVPSTQIRKLTAACVTDPENLMTFSGPWHPVHVA